MSKTEGFIKINKLGELPLPTFEEFTDARASYISHVKFFSGCVEQWHDFFSVNGKLSEAELEKGNTLIANLSFGYDLVNVKYLGTLPQKRICWDIAPPQKNYWESWLYWSDNERTIYVALNDVGITDLSINVYWFTGLLKNGHMLGYSSNGVNYDNLEDAFLFAGFQESAHNLRWEISQKPAASNIDMQKVDYLTYINTHEYEYQAFLVEMIMAKRYFPEYYPQYKKVYAELRDLQKK